MRVTLTTYHTSEIVTLEISTNIDMADLEPDDVWSNTS
jgi:hypothetical protein